MTDDTDALVERLRGPVPSIPAMRDGADAITRMGWRIQSLEATLRGTEARAEAAERALAAAEAEIERMREALTPSAETKAAYMGEFSVPLPDVDENGNEVMLRINVPWMTIKEIMAAIRQQALSAPVGEVETCQHKTARYNPEADNFYCTACNAGMGEEYYAANIGEIAALTPAPVERSLTTTGQDSLRRSLRNSVQVAEPTKDDAEAFRKERGE